MIIVAAYHRDTKEDLTNEQIQADMPELTRQHEEACEKEMTWDFFGGIIVLGEHEYQVC